MIMELTSSNLLEFMKKDLELTYETLIGHMQGLLDALAKLHTFGIHRDIKPENILIFGDKWVISDFGLCSCLEEDIDITGSNEKLGPKYWMSPEAINRVLGKKTEIIPQSDVFQLAAIFWYIIHKTHPTGIITEDDWKGNKKLFQPIIKALHHNPNKRPKDGAEFLEWFNKAIFVE